jgi:ATP phosphoribosyltransferase
MEVVMDLEFGKCKLQVQVPERGSITQPRQLVGKEVVTSFEWLTERYFARLEAEEEGDRGGAVANGTDGVCALKEDSTEPGRRKLRTEIDYVGGSVEIACSLGGADGVVDLVGAFPLFFLPSSVYFSLPSPHPLTPFYPPSQSPPTFPFSDFPPFPRTQTVTHPHSPPPESGETMRAAGLLPIATLVSSTAVLLSSTHPSNRPLVALIASRIKGVITAQRYVLCQYNIPRRLLPDSTKITPGRRAPTVTALDRERGGESERGGEETERGEEERERGGEEWVAVSSMVVKKEVAGAMDRLTEVGATDILVLGIENSRTG